MLTKPNHPISTIPLVQVAATPTDFTIFPDPSIVQVANSASYYVSGGVPGPLPLGSNSAPITVATNDGVYLRTIDGGTTPVAVQGSTNKKVRIRFATYKLTNAGFVVTQAAVKVGLGRVTGAPDVTVGSFVANKGTGIISVAAADLSGAATPATGWIITGNTGGGSPGICDVEVTFTNTDAKWVVIEYLGTQYLLSVALV